MDATRVAPGLPEHLLVWMEGAQRRVAAAFDVVLPSTVAALGLRRLRVLQMVSERGVRQQALADHALVSKQAIADIVDGLEVAGLVERTPDPHDGRAWLVRATRRGLQACAAMDEAMAQVERDIAHEIGVDRYSTFVDVLRELAPTAADHRSAGSTPAP